MTAKKSNRSKSTSNKPAAQKPKAESGKPQDTAPAPPAEQGTAPTPPPGLITEPDPPLPTVPRHRQCPICWEGMGGTGKAYSTHGSKTYYRCDCCGHTWTARITLEATVIEHRTVDIETRGE